MSQHTVWEDRYSCGKNRVVVSARIHHVFDCFFFSCRRRHTRFSRDWSSDVCSSDLMGGRPSRKGAGRPEPPCLLSPMLAKGHTSSEREVGTMIGQVDLEKPTTNGRTETTIKEVPAEVVVPDRGVKGGVFWGLSRIALGWVFLWAFLDKAFALGFATGRLESGGIDFFAKDAAWLNGGHPTAGFLEFGTKGPFKDFYAGLAGQTWVDWVYILSMLLIGLALILGIGK